MPVGGAKSTSARVKEKKVAANKPQEAPQALFVEQTVTYILETGGKLIVVENVPARVSPETGEHLFSPETVVRLQQTVWENQRPIKALETPVFEFAA